MRPRSLATILVAAMLLAGAGAAAAQGGKPDDKGKPDDQNKSTGAEAKASHGKARFDKDGDKWLLHNDDIRVWFHQNPAGKAKPMLKVWLNGTDGNETGYGVKFNRLYESEDANGTFSGRLNRMNLAAAKEWQVTTDSSNDSLTIDMRRADSQGDISLVFHLNTTSAEVKWDLIIHSWAWDADAANHTLVLDAIIHDAQMGNNTDDANVTVGEGGYISWDSHADASYGDNDTRSLNVTVMAKGGEADDNTTGPSSHLLFIFAGEGGYHNMTYDPVFGVASAATSPADVPSIGLFASLAAVATGFVLIAARRRR